jgi:phosphatidate cytidylyltransferase
MVSGGAGASSENPEGQMRSGLSNLQLRVISAIVMVAATLALTFLGGVWFRLLAAAMAAAMFYEWAAMARTPANAGLHLAAGGLLALALLALAAGATAQVTLMLAGAGVAITLAAGAWLGHGRSAAAGLAYAGLSGISLAYLRGDDLSGLSAILFLFAVVWTTDILAYFVGRAIGGPKLAPSISPGKTWSGAAGGAMGGLAAGLVAAAALGQPLAILAAVALLLSVVSQIGDLFESAVKRRHGAKDSGSLIPGHGGVMDRVDGLVAAAFALYVIGWLSAGPNNPAHGLFPV